jgi:hypothetical protein
MVRESGSLHANLQWGGASNGSVELTPCTDGTFCCGHNNLTCCGTQWAIRVPTQPTVVGANTTTTATVTATPDASAGPGIAAVAGLGIGLGVVMLVAAGVIYYLKRQNSALKKKNEGLAADAQQAANAGGGGGGGGAGGPMGTFVQQEGNPFRPLSYLPSSGAPTMVAPSSHVPSMQEFAAFKALYGTVLAHQNAQEMAAADPHRYSELDAGTAAAVRQQLSMAGVGSPPAVATSFEQNGGAGAMRGFGADAAGNGGPENGLFSESVGSTPPPPPPRYPAQPMGPAPGAPGA